MTDYVDRPGLGLSGRLKPHATSHVRVLRRSFATLLVRLMESHPSLGGGRVLDWGCSDRWIEGVVLRRFDSYVGVDLVGNRLADVHVSSEPVLPIRDGCIDCVLSIQVLEHVPDVGSYLRECNRVLQAGGRLTLSTNGHYRYHPDPTDLWRWTPEGLREEIEQHGLRVVQMWGVLRGPSAAMQLWQQTTEQAVHRRLRPAYRFMCQSAIAVIERRAPSEALDPDAAAFLVLAEKAVAETAAEVVGS